MSVSLSHSSTDLGFEERSPACKAQPTTIAAPGLLPSPSYLLGRCLCLASSNGKGCECCDCKRSHQGEFNLQTRGIMKMEVSDILDMKWAPRLESDARQTKSSKIHKGVTSFEVCISCLDAGLETSIHKFGAGPPSPRGRER